MANNSALDGQVYGPPLAAGMAPEPASLPQEEELAAGHMKHGGIPEENARAIARQQVARGARKARR